MIKYQSLCGEIKVVLDSLGAKDLPLPSVQTHWRMKG